MSPDVLAAYGPLGIIAAWLMFRVERKIDHVAESMNALTRGILIEVLTRRDVPPRIEQEARELLTELSPRSAG